MIVVFVPAYQDETYCLRDFLGIELAEHKKREMLGPGYRGTHKSSVITCVASTLAFQQDQVQKIYLDSDGNS
jgi:hypothetical protein